MKYTITIQWSEEDDAFLVYLPEFKDHVYQPVTHGETYEEALVYAKEVLEILIEELNEMGRELPPILAIA